MFFKKDGMIIGDEPKENISPDIRKGHKDAVISFTLGMLSILLSPFFVGIPGIILALIGFRNSASAQTLLPFEQRDCARTGFAMCVIGIIFSLIMLVLNVFILKNVVFPLKFN